MKILIVSDSHGDVRNIDDVLRRVKPIDMLIHCGDIEGSVDYLEKKAQCPTYVVQGNCDWGRDYIEKDLVVDIGKMKAFITHGHRYGVNVSLDGLISEAKKNGAEIALFGHLHVPMIEKKEGMMILNPGSIKEPRQEKRIPTYMLMEIDKKGEAHYTISEYIREDYMWEEEKNMFFFQNINSKEGTGKSIFLEKIKKIFE